MIAITRDPTAARPIVEAHFLSPEDAAQALLDCYTLAAPEYRRMYGLLRHNQDQDCGPDYNDGMRFAECALEYLIEYIGTHRYGPKARP